MKKVTLISLSLINFRGEKERTTVFHQEGETTIMGENGLGKSRHFDAFMWLLFGKDTKDRKDYNVKTLVDGSPVPKIDCEVSAIIDVDGQELALRRVYKEKWVKPRGQVDEIFKGNETETYWNDVPVNVTEYQKRVNEIIDDSVFKMITNPYFFASMKWQTQREHLFSLAGTIADFEIAAQKPEFASLLDRVSGKSLVDFKRELSTRKKRLKEDLAGIRPKIEQTHKLMPEQSDFPAIEKEIEGLEFQLAQIDKAISDKAEAIKQQYSAIQSVQMEINSLVQKQQMVLVEARSRAKEEAYKANSDRRELENNIKSTERELESFKRNTLSIGRELKDLISRKESRESEIATWRNKWYAENEKEFTGSDSCPTCSQELPEEMKADSRRIFAEERAKKLAYISDNGKRLNSILTEVEQDIAKTEKSLQTAENEASGKDKALTGLKEQLSNFPIASEKEINASDLPEYLKIGEEIKGKEAEMKSMEDANPDDNSELRAKKSAIASEISTLKNKLFDRELIARHTNEINSLETKGKELAQQIADAEREEYTIQQFTKAKIDECERRINSLFSHVTFKLFDYTIDGNEIETCVPLVNGVPFDVANTAGQVNAGLDIINALVKFYNVSAPIFIDNRESVNRIISTESQIINLVVSSDKQLVIK